MPITWTWLPVHDFISGIMDSKQITASPFAGIAFLDSWSDPDQLIAQKGIGLSPPLQDLLRWRGSLTQRLQDIIGERVELQLINHDRKSSWPNDDCFWPRMDPSPCHGDVLIRNAWLVLGGHRMVFAHSQILLDGLPDSDRCAIAAGNLALGYLFMEKNGLLKRENLQVNRVSCHHFNLLATFGGGQPCWCRRSMFHVNDDLRARILEIFPSALPAGDQPC
ncbi:MAG: chorismate lyase [Magnetococcales bacterium]|nr:chorismate lyase [Magnetococcales bacterium]